MHIRLIRVTFARVQYRAGKGGGLCMHFVGGSWSLQGCQLRCEAGAMTTVLALSGRSFVTVTSCLITRIDGVAIGPLGFVSPWLALVSPLVCSASLVKHGWGCPYSAALALVCCSPKSALGRIQGLIRTTTLVRARHGACADAADALRCR